ncbi:MAG TPA: aldo/keto reductase [Candidatus Sulfotelmatobacter sp.]|nr:aldo/keto reductase [Candidatus Sulfotelmatobacter sp.]
MVASRQRHSDGKYHGHRSPEQGRLNSDTMVAYKDLMPEQERTGRIVATIKAVSDQTGRGVAEVALAWLRYRPVPVIPIIRARKLSQLQDNLASFNVAFSAEQVEALDEASQIDPGFPYHLYAKESVRAIAFGGMRDQILLD